MNTTTAETLLRCHRAGRPSNSRMEKAVRLAGSDPAMRRKLDEQFEFDRRVVEKIQSFSPPENFQQKLDALSANSRRRMLSKIINPAVLSAVMGTLLLVGMAAFFVLDRMERFPGRDAVERIVASAEKMSGAELEAVSSTVGQIGDWLYMRGYEGYQAVPELAAVPVPGARVFQVDNTAVAQLAIEENGMLIYEFPAAELGVRLPDGAWQILQADAWVAAVRQHGAHVVILAFRGNKDQMRAFLAQHPRK